MKKIEVTVGARTKEELAGTLVNIAREVLNGKTEGYDTPESEYIPSANVRAYFKITVDHEG